MPLWMGWSSARTRHVHRDQSAQTGRERGHAGGEVRGIGEHHDIRREPLAVPAQELRQVLRTDLLLPLDDQLHVQGRRSLRREPRPQRREVEQQARLVVDHAASVEASVAAQRRLEGRRPPAIEAAGGLDVVVRIHEHGGCARARGALLCDDVGVRARETQQLDPVEPRPLEQPRDALGGALDLFGLEARRGDAGDARELHQVGERLVEPALERSHHLVGSRHEVQASGPYGSRRAG